MSRENRGEELSLLVRRLREARGLSQNALSRRAGLANSYINQLESGARGKRPSRDAILAIAQELRVSPDERDQLLHAAGLGGRRSGGRPTFEQFISSDPYLRSDQKEALIAQYRTYVRESR